MPPMIHRTAILLASLALAPLTAQAGGLILYEVGTDNVGLANAGAAARAQGPATLASNVAGMISGYGVWPVHGNQGRSRPAGGIPGHHAW